MERDGENWSDKGLKDWCKREMSKNTKKYWVYRKYNRDGENDDEWM